MRRQVTKFFTKEQEDFFIANQYGLMREELAQLMNKTFGLQLTVGQVKHQRRRLGLTGGPQKLYSRRYKPNSGQFTKGHMPHNHLPVGTEMVKTDGYLWRKIAEPNKWRQVHILLWEEANGRLPKGAKLTFLNGDITDVRLDNLELVSDAINGMITNYKLRYKDGELTRTGIHIVKLLMACKDKEGKTNGA